MATPRATHNLDASEVPDKILLFSGKRKSGKDFITDILHDRIGSDRSVVIKISGPIKSHWAEALNLDLDGLLSDGQYKEKYRMEMAKWGEEMRKKDPGCFCRAAIDMYNAKDKKYWIVSDVRRKTDVKWFQENYGTKCKTIRISSNQRTREKRGWSFTEGIDDAETECDLDDLHHWDLMINNDCDSNIDSILDSIMQLVN
ncbi:probable phosphomevalonate kinase [Venturia canescens]|uniref:probable phosphomevalonate kinase n=1 Tax=Venturia canescens TaxID=32260 RepID=UPI001C9D54AB|nr:probable phosphomevalonate kinase [Venturia canescens]